MKLSAITKYWNDYLSEWDIDPIAKMKKEKAAGRFFAHSRLLNDNIQYMPEPYYGDTEHPYCVIIDLNSGLSHRNDPEKLHGTNGFIYQCLHTRIDPNAKYNPCYSAVNNQYSPFLKSSIASIGTVNEIPGAAWWKDKRMKWLNSFLHRLLNITSVFPFVGQPLALELCPWHSKTWSNGIVHKMTPFLFDTVFEPAAEAIKLRNVGFGFCFGKPVGDILLANGFKVCKIWDKNSPIGKWPLTKKGALSDRTYRLLEGLVNNDKVYFLNLYANGTFFAPGKEFKLNVEPYIIKELHSMGFPKNRKNATTKSII